MPRLLLIACLALAACGADGPPEPPSKSGVTVTGDVEVGVVLK
jgi:predicted small lipoprotein YifL